MKNAEMRVTCPNCGEQIPIDEKAYHSIVNEVCNEEVNRRVNAVKEELEITLSEKADSIRQQAEAENQAELEKARRCYVELREKSGTQIAELKAIIDSAEMDKNLAVSEAVKNKDEMIADLNKDNIRLKEQLDFSAKAAASEMEALKARLENEHLDRVISLEADKNKIISELNADISALKAENKYKDDQIISLKDYKARLSTKLLGESLEQHCEQSYDHLIRPVIPNAVFEKDTAAGEKGDYIYREYDASGTELISILFEMKNEDDLSSSRKKKNKEHFDKLDRDRLRRGCQFAVLVSTLEPESDRYNSGICCITEYEKMFVIRPQCFIDFIYLMRLIADDNKKIIAELEAERNKNADIASFETGLDSVKKLIMNNNALARNHCEEVIKQIDRFIVMLERHKEKMLLWRRQSELTEKKTDRLSLKKLSDGNPTVQSLIEGADDGVCESIEEFTVTDVDETDIDIIHPDDESVA